MAKENIEQTLAEQKISKLLFQLAIPAILAQIIRLAYNMVDCMYIGRMADGSIAMAAIGICVPLTTIMNAFSGLFGRGGSPLSSIRLGENKHEEADRIVTNSFLALLASSVLLMIVVFLFQNSILYVFGATTETFQYAKDYLQIYMLGTIFIQLTVGLNYFIHAQGFTTYGMLTILLGAGLNIILDPIFIFTFNLGVKGAAIATILSQAVSFIFVILFFCGKKTVLHVQRKYMHFNASIMKQIMTLGISPFFMNSTEGLLTICFNQQLLRFGGTLAISSMTIMTSMFQFVLLPVEGIAQASQPIISYNYGAKNFTRVKDTVDLAIKVSLIYTVVTVICMEVFPQLFVGIFTSNEALMHLGCYMLRIYIFGGALIGINSTCQQTYNSLGEGKKSFFFAFLRKIILLIPLMYILPMFIENQLFAVILAEPISDIVTTISNYIYFNHFFHEKLISQ